jgi:hypothetical protein
MLPGDSRSAWSSDVLDDPRVVSLWDGDRIAGRWFGEHPVGGLAAPGSVIWDAYYALPASSTWHARPSGVLASGSDIIDCTAGLVKHFVPLLGNS